MLAGLITNSFVIIMTVCCLKTLKEPSTIFLTNMLLSNLIIAIFVMPFPIITCSIGEWVYGSTPEQKVKVCEFVACLLFYGFLVANESLVLVSCDRFFFIVTALQYKKYMTVNKAVIIVAASWILAAFMSILPLLGFGAYEFAYSYGTCVPGWEGQAGYSIFVFLVILVLVGSIIVTTIWTLCFTRKYLKNTATGSVPTDTQRSNVYASQQRRIIGLFGMLILVHLLCYTPAASIALIGLFTIIPPMPYAVVFVVLLLLNSFIPLVQSFFRRDIKEVVMKCGQVVCGKLKKAISTAASYYTLQK